MFDLSSLNRLDKQPAKLVDQALRDRFLNLKGLDNGPYDTDPRPDIVDFHQGTAHVQVVFDNIGTWGSPHLTQRSEDNGQVTYMEIEKPRFEYATARTFSQAQQPIVGDTYHFQSDSTWLDPYDDKLYQLAQSSKTSSDDTLFSQRDYLFRYDVGMPLPQDD